MGPTLSGFITFVYSVMAVPASALPNTSVYLTYAFNLAMLTVNPLIGQGCAGMPAPDGSTWTIYAVAVYNLAGSLLINYAQDQPGQTYFSTLRGPAPGGYAISNWVAGVVQAATDQGTGDTLLVPDAMKGLTMSDLQRLKDPFGRQYLALVQDWGPNNWGLT